MTGVGEQALTGEELRPLMFSVAYRMVGSVAEAEDIVQDAYVRMQQLQQSSAAEVASPEAYATTVTTRLAIDHLRSARVRRESYVGPWLPEPLLTTSGMDDPAVRAERTDTLSMAFLVMLETLTPVERAVFLLREVFEYNYADIAAIVEKSEANCRQILVRARRGVAERKPRFEASVERREQLAARFLAACEEGDFATLEELLAADVVCYGDGGGKAPAVKRPVEGRVQVARFLLGIVRQARAWGFRITPTQVNAQPGAFVIDADGGVYAVLSLDIVDGRVSALRNVLNPDKLSHLPRSFGERPEDPEDPEDMASGHR